MQKGLRDNAKERFLVLVANSHHMLAYAVNLVYIVVISSDTDRLP